MALVHHKMDALLPTESLFLRNESLKTSVSHCVIEGFIALKLHAHNQELRNHKHYSTPLALTSPNILHRKNRSELKYKKKLRVRRPRNRFLLNSLFEWIRRLEEEIQDKVPQSFFLESL